MSRARHRDEIERLASGAPPATGGGQTAAPLKHQDRLAKLRHTLDLSSGRGLEFGPLDRPIVRKEEADVSYVDAVSDEEARAALAGHPHYDVAGLVPVDHVWRGGPLAEVVGAARFDWAVASHVIEHVPDMLGWLRHVLDVLTPGGQLVLAIPDKRYTFDAARADTPIGQHLDAWIRSPAVPTAAQVHDHFSHAAAVGEAEFRGLWDGVVEPSQLRRLHTDEEALQHALTKPRDGVYADCHVSVFTPRSFLHAVSTLVRVGLLDVEVAEFFDTVCYANEFMVVLRKRAYRGEAERLDEARRILDAYLPGLDEERTRSPVRQAVARQRADAAGREAAAREGIAPWEAELSLRVEDAVRERDRARQERDRARRELDAVLGSGTWRALEPYRRLRRRLAGG